MNSLIKSLFRLTAITFVFALLTPVATTRADPNCDRHPENPKCSGDTSIVYTAELSLGGFVFRDDPDTELPSSTVEVLPDSKGTRLLSQTDLSMLRSDGDSNNSSWDTVFGACQLLNFPIEGFMVSNEKWSITNFDDIARIAFADVLLDGGKVTLILRGDGLSTDPFLPIPGGPESRFNLSEFSITGKSLRGVRPKTSCSPGSGQQIITLPFPSILTITATEPT